MGSSELRPVSRLSLPDDSIQLHQRSAGVAEGKKHQLRVFAGPPGGPQAYIAAKESGKQSVSGNEEFAVVNGDHFVVTDFTQGDVTKLVKGYKDRFKLDLCVVLRVCVIDSSEQAEGLAKDRGYAYTSLQVKNGYAKFDIEVQGLIALADFASSLSDLSRKAHQV